MPEVAATVPKSAQAESVPSKEQHAARKPCSMICTRTSGRQQKQRRRGTNQLCLDQGKFCRGPARRNLQCKVLPKVGGFVRLQGDPSAEAVGIHEGAGTGMCFTSDCRKTCAHAPAPSLQGKSAYILASRELQRESDNLHEEPATARATVFHVLARPSFHIP
eukprot:scaffold1554_cov332-Pavlova_lutheri.AAC.6